MLERRSLDLWVVGREPVDFPLRKALGLDRLLVLALCCLGPRGHGRSFRFCKAFRFCDTQLESGLELCELVFSVRDALPAPQSGLKATGGRSPSPGHWTSPTEHRQGRFLCHRQHRPRPPGLGVAGHRVYRRECWSCRGLSLRAAGAHGAQQPAAARASRRVVARPVEAVSRLAQPLRTVSLTPNGEHNVARYQR